MVYCNELVASAVQTITVSMNRWKQGELHDDESDLIAALQIAVDLSGGIRWIDQHKGTQCPLIAPMRAGEYVSFDWNAYQCELCVPYHGIHIWLSPAIGEELMVNVVA